MLPASSARAPALTSLPIMLATSALIDMFAALRVLPCQVAMLSFCSVRVSVTWALPLTYQKETPAKGRVSRNLGILLIDHADNPINRPRPGINSQGFR